MLCEIKVKLNHDAHIMFTKYFVNYYYYYYYYYVYYFFFLLCLLLLLFFYYYFYYYYHCSCKTILLLKLITNLNIITGVTPQVLAPQKIWRNTGSNRKQIENSLHNLFKTNANNTHSIIILLNCDWVYMCVSCSTKVKKMGYHLPRATFVCVCVCVCCVCNALTNSLKEI